MPSARNYFSHHTTPPRTIWIARAFTPPPTTKRGKSYVHQIKATISCTAHYRSALTLHSRATVVLYDFRCEKNVPKHMPVKKTTLVWFIFSFCVRLACTWDLRWETSEVSVFFLLVVGRHVDAARGFWGSGALWEGGRIDWGCAWADCASAVVVAGFFTEKSWGYDEIGRRRVNGLRLGWLSRWWDFWGCPAFAVKKVRLGLKTRFLLPVWSR